MRIYFLNSQRLSELCFLSQLSALCFWTSTFHFSAFCLFGTDSSFPPKLYEGSLGGHSPHFQGRTRTFEKRVKLHYGNLMFPFCSHSLILRVTPQWCSSSTCLPTGFAFSGRIWFLSAFPLLSGGVSSVLAWTWTQSKFMFNFCCCFPPFLGSPELHGSCTIYLMPYCSCSPLCSKNVFLVFDDSVTQASR